MPGEDDGTFLMEFSDFCTIFTELYMCIQTSLNDRGYRYECTWDLTNNWGAPIKRPDA